MLLLNNKKKDCIIAQWKEQFQNEMIVGSNPTLCSLVGVTMSVKYTPSSSVSLTETAEERVGG